MEISAKAFIISGLSMQSGVGFVNGSLLLGWSGAWILEHRLSEGGSDTVID